MRKTIPPLPQYTFMAWCSVKEQVQLYLYPTLNNICRRVEVTKLLIMQSPAEPTYFIHYLQNTYLEYHCYTNLHETKHRIGFVHTLESYLAY